MTLLAGCGEPRMCHGGGRGVVVVLVAADAGRVGDIEIVVDVAISTRARRNGVRTGQREARCRVVKRCRLPGCGVVTGFAGLRESLSRVVRIRGALVITQVT